jgi:hypothetical protein
MGCKDGLRAIWSRASFLLWRPQKTPAENARSRENIVHRGQQLQSAVFCPHIDLSADFHMAREDVVGGLRGTGTLKTKSPRSQSPVALTPGAPSLQLAAAVKESPPGGDGGGNGLPRFAPELVTESKQNCHDELGKCPRASPQPPLATSAPPFQPCGPPIFARPRPAPRTINLSRRPVWSRQSPSLRVLEAFWRQRDPGGTVLEAYWTTKNAALLTLLSCTYWSPLPARQ